MINYMDKVNIDIENVSLLVNTLSLSNTLRKLQDACILKCTRTLFSKKCFQKMVFTKFHNSIKVY